jgi:hypothetical protein
MAGRPDAYPRTEALDPLLPFGGWHRKRGGKSRRSPFDIMRAHENRRIFGLSSDTRRF